MCRKSHCFWKNLPKHNFHLCKIKERFLHKLIFTFQWKKSFYHRGQGSIHRSDQLTIYSATLQILQIFHCTSVHWSFLIIPDVQKFLNKCSAESPCEANTGYCTLDNECIGHLICTKNNNEGSTLPHSPNQCKEPGDDMFSILAIT